MQCCFGQNIIDYGPYPYTANIAWEAWQNQNFRTTLWTGSHLQLTLMNIVPYGEIGMERHEGTDQYVRIEYGQAIIMMGTKEGVLDTQYYLGPGDVVLIPAGTWHNIVNGGMDMLKLSSIYAPPEHAPGTVHTTKEEAERAEY